MRHISDAERRARIAVRHGLAPAYRPVDAEAATRAMTVLHATEPATVYLSLWARVDGITVDEIDRALYEDRSLVKQLAMRRTLFVFPRDLLPAAWGSASARVAAQLRPRLAREVESGGLTDDGVAWVDSACTAVLRRLADGSELSAQALREELPELEGRVAFAPGKSWGGSVAMGPRVLSQLGVEGRIVRGRNGGHWRISRPLWTSMASWLGDVPAPWPAREGYAELARRWLRTFGPGTSADLRWWLGSTVADATHALTDVGAVPVSLDGGDTGWVLPGDEDPVAVEEPWAVLLPVLDPTVMGWKQRDFFLGPHGQAVFDRNGNGGTTAWWNGRIVGCWIQDDTGTVRISLLERVPGAARRALEQEAERLTEWLGGDRLGTVYSSPAMKAAAGG